MTAPAAILCQGTTLSFNSAAVGGVISITGIGSGSATEIDISTLASTAKEYAQGLRDFGDISIEMIRNQDDVGQVALFDSAAAQGTHTVVVTLPTSTANVGTFQGFVKSLSTDIKADGAVMGKCVIRITGSVVWS